ncbi:MAG: NADH-quinone oxidoreductase subunit NuoK [Armatimonadota bacterium]|jgi:NADH-quinone oxidoreductase subunit K
MNNVPISHAMIFAGALFMIGVLGVVARRNLVIVLMSIELMLSSAALAFIAAAAKWNQTDGQVFFIFIIVTAAAEVAVGLSLVLRIYHKFDSLDSDDISLLREERES